MEITLYEIFTILTTISEVLENDEDTLPAEVLTMLDTFDDGECGNNDTEKLLLEIRDNLTYDTNLSDEKTSALSEVSQRLEVIDTRIDKGFTAVTDGLGLIFTCVTLFSCFKFLNWLMRPFTTG